MKMPGDLSLEQEFELQLLREQVKQLSLDQAQDYVVEMMRQMMLKENLFKQLMRRT
ncbi:NblA/ycf18 family protein [Leptolyngbya cf. ectocarpi LEGE 11479]|uniref:NblA/ycf18 family protein n=1 Tax=Leptolyngbya cf. ectocarpi LEGE 11479 TaxID=1828722 RepID=A0A929F9V6_LEPEC|nr:NblA/ycf18 family protein [Leptolyngbya ectocarpi]MBE9067779.1 NblA/ycf18 family protein [Leptolyngbya cf. ectocarpi LEGE 11479]